MKNILTIVAITVSIVSYTIACILIYWWLNPKGDSGEAFFLTVSMVLAPFAGVLGVAAIKELGED